MASMSWSHVLQTIQVGNDAAIDAMVREDAEVDRATYDSESFCRALHATPDASRQRVYVAVLILMSKHGLSSAVREVLRISDDTLTVSDVNPRGESALSSAIVAGHLELVREMINEYDASPVVTWPHGTTPLSVAVTNNCITILECLLSVVHRSDDVNRFCTQGESLLAIASRLGHVEAASILIAHGVCVNGVETEPERARSDPPLGCARNLAMASLLVSNGADVFGDSGAAVVLHGAVSDQPELVQYLLDQGADVRRDRYADSIWPPSTAILVEQMRAMEIAINHGIDLDARLTNGLTVLQLSLTQKAWRDAVRYLLAHGADVWATNDRGMNAIDIARIYQPEAVRLLMGHLNFIS